MLGLELSLGLGPWPWALALVVWDRLNLSPRLKLKLRVVGNLPIFAVRIPTPAFLTGLSSEILIRLAQTHTFSEQLKLPFLDREISHVVHVVLITPCKTKQSYRYGQGWG